MTILTMQIAQAMDTTPWLLDLSFPDLAALLPFVLVCLTSVALTTGWLLAVSRYACKRMIHR
jgi:hypothetical protein